MRISAFTTSRRSSSRTDTTHRSFTVPSSPTRSPSSSSSSDFEFDIGSSAATDDIKQRSSFAQLTPADDLFYKGKILPLQPTPRLYLLKSLLFAPSYSVSVNSRHSICSSSAIFTEDDVIESPRPNFIVDMDQEDEEEYIVISEPMNLNSSATAGQPSASKIKSFSFGKLSSVLKKERRTAAEPMINYGAGSEPANRTSRSLSARDMMRKYMKKVKPLYEKMGLRKKVSERESSPSANDKLFSRNRTMDRNLNAPGAVMSCPASIRSSPYHSGVLLSRPMAKRDSSSEELHSAIQGAIAHCKNSMLRTQASCSPVSDQECPTC